MYDLYNIKIPIRDNILKEVTLHQLIRIDIKIKSSIREIHVFQE